MESVSSAQHGLLIYSKPEPSFDSTYCVVVVVVVAERRREKDGRGSLNGQHSRVGERQGIVDHDAQRQGRIQIYFRTHNVVAATRCKR